MQNAQLNSGDLAKYTPLGHDGQPVYLNADAFISALSLDRDIGEKRVRHLAIPRIREESNQIDWYVPFPPSSPDGQYKIISWPSATTAEKTEALAQLKDFEHCLKRKGEQLKKRTGTSSSSILFAHYLSGANDSVNLPAIHFPTKDCVYIVDGTPVITFWGFTERQNNNNLAGSPFSVLDKGYAAPHVRPQNLNAQNDVAAAPLAQAAAPRKDATFAATPGMVQINNNNDQNQARRGFPWWILILILLLLLLAALWYWWTHRDAAEEFPPLPDVEQAEVLDPSEEALPEDNLPPEKPLPPEPTSKEDQLPQDQGYSESPAPQVSPRTPAVAPDDPVYDPAYPAPAPNPYTPAKDPLAGGASQQPAQNQAHQQPNMPAGQPYVPQQQGGKNNNYYNEYPVSPNQSSGSYGREDSPYQKPQQPDGNVPPYNAGVKGDLTTEDPSFPPFKEDMTKKDVGETQSEPKDPALNNGTSSSVLDVLSDKGQGKDQGKDTGLTLDPEEAVEPSLDPKLEGDVALDPLPEEGQEGKDGKDDGIALDPEGAIEPSLDPKVEGDVALDPLPEEGQEGKDGGIALDPEVAVEPSLDPKVEGDVALEDEPKGAGAGNYPVPGEDMSNQEPAENAETQPAPRKPVTIQGIDANNNGVLDDDDTLFDLEKQFALPGVDRNHDGLLSKKELELAGLGDDLFGLRDMNRDGVIDKRDLKYAGLTPKALEVADKNKDGILDTQELSDLFKVMVPKETLPPLLNVDQGKTEAAQESNNPYREAAKEEAKADQVHQAQPQIQKNELQFTSEELKTQGSKVMDGKWDSRSGLMDSSNGRPLKMGFDFNGKDDKVMIIRHDGSECVAKAKVQAVNSGISITPESAALCPDQRKYQLPRIQCNTASNGQVRCYGQAKNRQFPIVLYENK